MKAAVLEKPTPPARSTPIACAPSCWCASPAPSAASAGASWPTIWRRSPRIGCRRRNGARCSTARSTPGWPPARSRPRARGCEASEAGVARAAIFLGLKGSLPRSWERAARRAPGRQGARAGARAGQAPQGAGARRTACARPSCSAPTASRSRAWRRPRGCARRWRRWRWSAPSATRSRRACRQARPVGQGRPAAGGAACQEAARLRHRRAPRRGACRRARRRQPRPISRRCAWPCCAAISTAPASPRPSRPAPRRRAPLRPAKPRLVEIARPTHVQRQPSRPPRPARSRRLRPRGAAARRGAGAGLARQPQGLHLPRLAPHPRAAPGLGPLRDRVQVHAGRGASRRPAWRSPTPT